MSMGKPVESKTPHDAVFRKVFAKPAVAAEFFQDALPEALVENINWNSLVLEPASFVDEEFQSSASDLLFSAQMGDDAALLYCLFEHQSTPDARMPLRLLGYVTRILQRAVSRGEAEPDQLPPIIPVVLFQGPRSWQPSTRFIDALKVPGGLLPEVRKYLLDFEHFLVDLSDWSPDLFRERVLLRGILAIMKAVRDGRVEEVSPVLFPLMDEVIRRSTATGILESLLYYVGTVGPEPLFKEMRRSIRATQGPEEEKRAMTKFAQQMLERGERRGKKTGKVEGLREAVMDYLRMRFGELPANLRERIDSVESPDELKKLNRAAWESDSLEEFKKVL
jgi:predicted transposase/invertase (TIGR01784 family)